MKYRLFFPIGLLLALLTAGVALAQTATPVTITDDQVNAVASELYCPECENIPLDVCPSQACADMREEIRLKLQQGQTKGQIKQYFIERYGDRVVGAPPAHGWNWLLYVIPPVVILAAVAFLYRTFRRWQTSSPKPAQQSPELANPPAASNKYVSRLEAELKKAKKE
jgi:cytochrome c-type biogenesis protein CcmH